MDRDFHIDRPAAMRLDGRVYQLTFANNRGRTHFGCLPVTPSTAVLRPMPTVADPEEIGERGVAVPGQHGFGVELDAEGGMAAMNIRSLHGRHPLSLRGEATDERLGSAISP